MFCARCGSQVREVDIFCRHCGNPLKLSQSISKSPIDLQYIEKNLSHTLDLPNYNFINANSGSFFLKMFVSGAINLKIATILILIASVLVGALYYTTYLIPKPSDTVEKFVQAFNDKDLNKLISCFDPKIEKAYNATSNILSNFLFGINLRDLADLFPVLYESLKLASGDATDVKMKIVNIKSEEIFGNDATVVAEIELITYDQKGLSSKDKCNFRFSLKKFDEGWRIINTEIINIDNENEI